MPKGDVVAALQIRQDYTPSELRRRAARARDRRAALRLLAIANALEGMTRAEAARLAGMERQALRQRAIVLVQMLTAEGIREGGDGRVGRLHALGQRRRPGGLGHGAPRA